MNLVGSIYATYAPLHTFSANTSDFVIVQTSLKKPEKFPAIGWITAETAQTTRLNCAKSGGRYRRWGRNIKEFFLGLDFLCKINYI